VGEFIGKTFYYIEAHKIFFCENKDKNTFFNDMVISIWYYFFTNILFLWLRI
jgi:hypothetical protein